VVATWRLSRYTCRGAGTLAVTATVPFFFLWVVFVTVTLFDGAAATRHGLDGPAMRVELGELPLRLARPMNAGTLMLAQKTYCGLTATPQTLPAPTMKLLVCPPAP